MSKASSVELTEELRLFCSCLCGCHGEPQRHQLSPHDQLTRFIVLAPSVHVLLLLLLLLLVHHHRLRSGGNQRAINKIRVIARRLLGKHVPHVDKRVFDLCNGNVKKQEEEG